MRVCIDVCMYAFVCTYVYICVCVCMCVCTTKSTCNIMRFFKVDERLIPHLSCEGNDDDSSNYGSQSFGGSRRGKGQGTNNPETKWALGETFHR